MQLIDLVKNHPPGKILFFTYLPLIGGLVPWLVFKQAGFLPILLGAWLHLSASFLYTTILAQWLKPNRRASFFCGLSILASLVFLLSILNFNRISYYAFLIFWFSEIMRTASLTRSWLKAENRKWDWFDAFAIFWLIQVPYLGWWNLHQRAVLFKASQERRPPAD